ncbi:MAG: VWA domain-containing protein [Gammaproteobacteria bacterium]|nr:VWA domain-containing protein [Gammaproteobacteria bacterium]
MFEFAWPWLLGTLPLPWLLSLRRLEDERGEEALRVPFFTNLKVIAGTASALAPRHGQVLAWLIWLALVLAAARPQWLDEGVELSTSGRDLLVAVDISGSMRVPDMELGGKQTDRLTMIKAVLTRFLARREGDRIGLVLFGLRAYLQTPLSFDRKTVQYFLNDAEIGLAGDGTAIGDAIGLAIKRLKDRPAQNRVLILLTDGANNAGELDPAQAARLAAEAGVRVYTIGVGADELIMNDPIFGQRVVNPSEGLDEAILGQIAQTTGGRYFRARDTERLEAIYALLDELEPVAGERETFRPALALYPWPLGLALALWLLNLSGFAGRRARRRT